MAGVTLLTACDNALNETDYTYSISSETFYNTVEEANAAVLAPLDAMRSAYNSNFFARSIQNIVIQKEFIKHTNNTMAL